MEAGTNPSRSGRPVQPWGRLRKAWRWLRVVLGIALLGYLVWRIDWREIGRVLVTASPGWMGVALALELLSLLPRVWRWKVLLATQGTRLPLRRLLSTYMVGAFFSNFLPSDVGGDAMRMLRLAQDTRQRADAVSSVLVERLCGLFAVLLLGVAAVLGNWAMASRSGVALPVLAAFCVFVVGVVLLANLGTSKRWEEHPRRPWFSWAVAKLQRLYASVTAFRQAPGALLQVVALSLLFRLVNVLGLHALSQSLHLSVSFVWMATVLSLTAVVSALPLSLNALGIKEGAYVFFLGMAGVAAPEALALALLARTATLAVSLLGGIVYLAGK